MSLLNGVNHILRRSRAQRNKPPVTTPPPGWMPWPYVDTLYDYTRNFGQPLSTPLSGRVAIVGAGAAGLCAAYELLRCGLVPTVYEASDRIGGRAWSQPFHDGSQPSSAFAELGSMRVPPSQQVFNLYARQFGMTPAPGGFPDPGVVPTRLYYENTSYDWAANELPPGPFTQISHDFTDWIDTFANQLLPPWYAGDMETVRQVWQSFIDQYRNVSFFEAVVAGIPQWTPEQLNAFGALGVGSGGFGPLYEVNMLEMLRIILQGWEDNQQLYVQGMTALCDGFYNTVVSAPGLGDTSLAQQQAVRFNSPVTAIDHDPGTGKPILSFGSAGAIEFDAVIVATTTRAAEGLGLTMPGVLTSSSLVSQSARVALRDLHMTSSSKTFIRTATKFWKNQPGFFPSNVQTDEAPRGVYTLDYPGTDNGIVLVSYTWEDDSLRLQALDTASRYAMLAGLVDRMAPEWRPFMNPVNGEILSVDWQSQNNYFGAFKLNYPGQEPSLQAAYYQFQSVLDPSSDMGIYLAGDGVSYSGGWTEGALQTALNAASAVARRLGGTLPSYNPVDDQSASLYSYGTPPGSGSPGPRNG